MDTRTLREKLEAMAEQDISPYESEIARAKLDAMGTAPPLPPRRPPSAAAAPMPFSWSGYSTTTNAGSSANVYWGWGMNDLNVSD